MNTFSGYIEIEVDGRKMPFKFGSNAYALFCQMRGIEFWQLAESGVFGRIDEEGKIVQLPDFGALRDLFFCAHQAAMRSKGESEMVNTYQLGDILDEYPEVVIQLQTAMINAKLMGFKTEDIKPPKAEVKKK